MPYTSRHMRRPGARPGLFRYSAVTIKQYQPKQFVRSEEDEALLNDLRTRGSKNWTQIDAQAFEDVMDRDNARLEAAHEPLKREIEGYFEHLNLPALPAPLPPSSLWVATSRAENCPNKTIQPFMVACDKGNLELVKHWIQDRDLNSKLQQIGIQDGLAFAAQANQVNIASYLLQKGGAYLHGAVVEAACDNLSLPLFELCVQHGYHPNQQIPSRSGGFGVAINHCITNVEITRFLLEHGADPNVAPFMDGRTSGWGEKATPPMDRTSGLALDRAITKSPSIVVQMLLEHGADPKYSRPIHGIVERLHSHPIPGAQQEWRPLMVMVLNYGAEINAVTYSGGTALQRAVHKKNWDIVEFLIEKGADPFVASPVSGRDAFDSTLKFEDQPWSRSEEVKEYLTRLMSGSKLEIGGEAPEEARENPLVQIIQKVKRREAGLIE
ncbi:ankyrin repeat domain protein [Fusarium sp. NRRL 25303]|nr:ankyrin repeat domain protein [Fusarium sp. NRRL 25303]